MVGRRVDIQGHVVWFAEGLVLPGIQVEREVEKIGDLDVSFDGDSEAKVLEVLRYCFPCAIRIGTGCIPEVAEAVIIYTTCKKGQRRRFVATNRFHDPSRSSGN